MFTKNIKYVCLPAEQLQMESYTSADTLITFSVSATFSVIFWLLVHLLSVLEVQLTTMPKHESKSLKQVHFNRQLILFQRFSLN